MRRRNWILAIVLCAGILLAMAQTVRAEPDDIPGDAETTADSDTTTRSRSTYDWEMITDEHGVTVYPPPPDEGIVPSSGTTTTTKKTSRTTAPFQWNPAHPDDNYTGALPYRALPGFYEEVTDEYGNVVTRTVNAQATTETTMGEPTEETTMEEEIFPDEPQSPKQPFNWAIVVAAGAVLLAAAVGGIIVLTKGRKDSDDDDYIYEDEPAQPEEPPEE